MVCYPPGEPRVRISAGVAGTSRELARRTSSDWADVPVDVFIQSDFNKRFQCLVLPRRSSATGASKQLPARASLELASGSGGRWRGGGGQDRGHVRKPTVPAFHRDRPGMSAFVLEHGVIYTPIPPMAAEWTPFWGMYQWLTALLRSNEMRLVASPRRVRKR